MPTRSKKHQKTSTTIGKLPVSGQQVLELCRRPSVLIFCGCLGLATILGVWASRSSSDSVADSDLTDEQLESDFLALGALGVSDSANPSPGSVNPQFNFDETPSPAEPPIFDEESAFISQAVASSSTPDFEPSFESDGPRFGRPIVTTDPRSESAVQQAGFERTQPSSQATPGARVTANQAVWLTGSIETR